jgi:YVTN family beta-propeller protein
VPHKRAGKVTVVDLVHDKVQAILSTGPDTNHPNFADTPTGDYAYVTVGGLNETLVYARTSTGPPPLVASIHDNGNAPHGIWPSGDYTRMYVGMEKSDSVDVIDTATNEVIDTLAIGQEPQALVYVPNASPQDNAPNLGTQGLGQQGHNVPTTLPDGTQGETLDPVLGRHLEATVRLVAGVDMIDLQARNLQPNTTYEAYNVDAKGTQRSLVTFAQGCFGREMVLRLAPAPGEHEEEIASHGGEDSPHRPAHHRTGRDHHHEAPPPTGQCVTPAAATDPAVWPPHAFQGGDLLGEGHTRRKAYAVSRRQIIPVSGPDSVVNSGWAPRGIGTFLTTPDPRRD